MKRGKTTVPFAIGVAVVLAACGDHDPAGARLEPHVHAERSDAIGEGISRYLEEVNGRLATEGAGYALLRAEFVSAPTHAEAGPNVVFANDRARRLPSRWVPGDPRRAADGNNITFMNGPLLTANEFNPAPPVAPSLVEGAIDRAFATWNGVECSALRLVKRPFSGGLPSGVLGTGNPFVADIVTLGFLPGGLFDDVLGPGARQNVLGVTFTAAFGSFDAAGVFTPSDVDGDGRDDTAFKEIWYNDDFFWTATGTGGVDIETVALHENGHALELDHFGRLSFDPRRQTVQASPRAVMNAVILGTLRTPRGTDNASYCQTYANWPR